MIMVMAGEHETIHSLAFAPNASDGGPGQRADGSECGRHRREVVGLGENLESAVPPAHVLGMSDTCTPPVPLQEPP